MQNKTVGSPGQKAAFLSCSLVCTRVHSWPMSWYTLKRKCECKLDTSPRVELFSVAGWPDMLVSNVLKPRSYPAWISCLKRMLKDCCSSQAVSRRLAGFVNAFQCETAQDRCTALCSFHMYTQTGGKSTKQSRCIANCYARSEEAWCTPEAAKT